MGRFLEQFEQGFDARKNGIYSSFLVAALVALFFTTRVNYLLFHGLAELFSIVVGFSIFLIAWNSKRFIDNQYLLYIGIAYFFISFLDLLHTLAYKGMPVFTDYDYYANQLWIGARYMESLSLLGGFYFFKEGRKVPPHTLFVLYLLVSAVLVAVIFWLKIFPECFIDGQGLTPFKKNSEYIICGILAGTSFLLVRNKARFADDIFRLLIYSLIFTIVSELAFTFYISNYGISNLVGHYFKIFSFYCVYKAIVKTGIQNPYKLIFRELEESNRLLRDEVAERKRTEKKLQAALAEVKTLSGIIPICSHCKQIRDDAGYWQRVEAYMAKHANAQFTHGICPDCFEKEMKALDEE